MSQAERQRSYDRAVGWLKANEGKVLQNRNVALWWILDTAARTSKDPYLTQLVERYVGQVPADAAHLTIWRRMVRPDTAAGPYPSHEFDALLSYQRFFAYALSCDARFEQDTDVQQHLSPQLCRPLWGKVWRGDLACTTHQLMGLMLMERQRCGDPAATTALKRELIPDVRTQMAWDVIVDDAYLQRVMMLSWLEGASSIKPIWLSRVAAAQTADGGWSGRPHMPEWPAWAQPHAWRAGLAAVSRRFEDGREEGAGFHATAQGLLIMALSLREAPRDAAPQGLPN